MPATPTADPILVLRMGPSEPDPEGDARFLALGMHMGAVERLLMRMTDDERRQIWPNVDRYMDSLTQRFAPREEG